MTSTILVIDDDKDTAELIQLILKPHAINIYHVVNGTEGLKKAYELQPDLIILDIMMPEQDGFEVCTRIREFSDIPILMLTAKSQSADVARGFAVGADDYVKKPFSNEELISRIDNLLRRKKTNGNGENIRGYSDDILKVEFASREVRVNGKEVPLTSTEFKLLSTMIRHPQKTLSTHALLSEVWGDAYSYDKSLPSLYIHQIREKLKEAGTEHSYIQTQWGQGYSFTPLPKKNIVATAETSTETPDLEENISVNLRKWIWVLGLILLGIVITQIDQISSFILGYDKNSTVLDALIIADGFFEDGQGGAKGEICVSNEGRATTQNLAIVTTIQSSGENISNIYSTSLDTGERPVIEAGEAYCYPYKIFLDTQNAKSYQINAIITITNYRGLHPGSKHCPGEDACAFGPNLVTEFSIPEP